MKSWEDEARQLRELIDDLSNRVDQLLADAPIDNFSAVFAIDMSGAPGTDPHVFFRAYMQRVTGPEVENGTASAGNVGGPVMIAGLGTKVPPNSVYVLA